MADKKDKKANGKAEGKILVLTDYNWADECDFEGFCVMTQAELDKAKADVKKYFEKNESFTHSYGTNEDESFESYEQVFDNVEEKKISDEEAKVLEKLLEGRRGVCLRDIIESMETEDIEGDEVDEDDLDDDDLDEDLDEDLDDEDEEEDDEEEEDEDEDDG
jgi:hypothetical protein